MNRVGKIAVGSGAIGSYYGAKLAHAGNDLHFLMRGDLDDGHIVLGEFGRAALSRTHDVAAEFARASVPRGSRLQA